MAPGPTIGRDAGRVGFPVPMPYELGLSVLAGAAMPVSRLAVSLFVVLAAAPPVAAQQAGATVPQAVLTVHDRAVANGECVPLETLLQWYQPSSAPLSDTETLYILPCDQGVSNSPSKLYVMTGGDTPQVHALSFAQYDVDFGWIGDGVLYNAAYDPATRTLTGHESYSTLGDCGTAATWVWRKFAFAMVEYRLQAVCDGTHRFGSWPVIWKAREASLEGSLDKRTDNPQDLYFYQVLP
jgi:hypothetical protein